MKLNQTYFLGREFCAAADRRVHPGRRQALPVRLVPHHQGQAGADQTVAPVGRRLCARRLHASGPQENSVRRRSASSPQSW